MKQFLAAVLFAVCISVQAQKSYLVHLTIDKLFLGSDSVVYPKGKTFVMNITSKSDTVEVGKPGGVPVAILVDIRRIKRGDRIINQVGYAFLQKTGGKWTLIKHFGYTDRYDFPTHKPGFENTARKTQAKDEFHCDYGVPRQFAADFRMDIYRNDN
ncbi:MAG TPA: hypothetical protein VFU15_15710 [Bacteroidia bacterium]|nr:hypothetical protein [Bacteroidia bacterium]